MKSCRYYECKDGRKVLLDFSWEEIVAKRLDEINIMRIRPKPIKYELEGKQYNYFPDFYLPDFDTYLDLKNKFVYRAQEKKINILKLNLSNLVFLLTEKDCKNYDPRSLHKSSKLVP